VCLTATWARSLILVCGPIGRTWKVLKTSSELLGRDRVRWVAENKAFRLYDFVRVAEEFQG